MRRFLMMCVLGALLLEARVQPIKTSTCKSNHECPSKHYCSPEPGSHCVPCINCTESNRAGAANGNCAKSVLDCGDCFDGFIETLLIAGKCVRGSRDTAPGSAEQALPYYVWVPMLICVIVVLVALLVIFVPKIRRAYAHTTSTRAAAYSGPASKEAAQAATPRAPPDEEPRAPAPTPPPPYNVNVYSGYPREGPESPLIPTAHFGFIPGTDGESLPAVKRSESAKDHGRKEKDFNQEAVVFNLPHYITPPDLPPSYVENDEPSAHDLPHDEDTMESAWTPATEQPVTSFNLPAVLDEYSEEPPSKVLCVRGRDQPSSRVRNAEAIEAPTTSGGSSQGGPAPAPSQPRAGPAPPPSQPEPPRETNVTLNINFQQLNDVKLLRI